MRSPTTAPRTAPPLGATIAYLAGIAGVAAGITLNFIGMRAVMDVGGFCAEGGPYVVETPCPEGVALLVPLGIIGGLAAAAVAAGAGSRLGGSWSAVVLLAWPALFGALGWNFLEYGLNPPGDDPGWAWGWLVCGVVFWAMALVPLYFGIQGALAARSSAGGSRLAGGTLRPGRPSSRDDRMPSRAAASPADAEPGEVFLLPLPPDDALADAPVGAAADLVAGLERLAALRSRGELTADEYAAAKRALIADAAEGAP
jgi:hypothetical protein